jgi:hypothetical protein
MYRQYPEFTTIKELPDSGSWAYVYETDVVENVLEYEGLMGRLLNADREALAKGALFLMVEMIPDSVDYINGNIYIGHGTKYEVDGSTQIRRFKEYVREV